MQVEGQQVSLLMLATGARVRNAYATCPLQEDSPWKRGLILHMMIVSPGTVMKALVVKDGHAYD